MKYSLMSHMIDREIKLSKPNFIHRLILNDMGYEGGEPEIEEMFRFFNEHGLPLKNGTMTFRDFVRIAGEHGFDGVDMMSYHFDEAGEDAKEILEEYGVTLAAVNILTEFNNAVTEEDFNRILGEVKDIMDRVYRAGGRNILLMPSGYFSAPDVSREQAFHNIVRGLKAGVEYGNSIGLTVNTETLESIAVPMCSTGELIRLFEAVPGLKYNHDTGNPAVALEDPIDTYRKFKHLLANVHFKDLAVTEEKTMIMDALGRHLITSAPGAGFIDLRKHLELLIEDDYQGFITLEGLMPDENVLEGAVKALEYFRNMEEEIRKC